MRRFQVYRRKDISDSHDENQRVEPDKVQFEGIVFTDGTVAVRWRTAKGSTSLWANYDDLMAVHGHPEYGTEVEWLDPEEEEVYYTASCGRCGIGYESPEPIINVFCPNCRSLKTGMVGVLNS